MFPLFISPPSILSCVEIGLLLNIFRNIEITDAL